MDYFKIDSITETPKDQAAFQANMVKLGVLLVPLFTISEVGITHRWITHWEKSGLIDLEREDTGWRKFTFIEYVWLRVIVELRKFNLPLSVIKTFKENLFKPYENAAEAEAVRQKLEEGSIPIPDWVPIELIKEHITELLGMHDYLFRSVIAAIYSRKPLCFLISLDGDFRLIDARDDASTMDGVYEFLELIKSQNFVCVNLQLILQDFYRNDKIKTDTHRALSILTEQEMKILEIIRKGDFKEIIIKERSKKNTYKLEIKKEFPVKAIEKRVMGMLSDNELEEIRIIGYKGKASLYEKTIRQTI